jgi:hypothetical protein
VGFLILGISRLQLGSLRTKWYFSVGPVAKQKKYYKGEGGGFPQVRVMVSLVNPCLPMAHLCTKKCIDYALTNLLFGLCRFMWIIEPLVARPNPISELQHAVLPPKCYEPKNVPQLFLLLLSSPFDLQLNPSKNLGVHHNECKRWKNVCYWPPNKLNMFISWNPKF